MISCRRLPIHSLPAAPSGACIQIAGITPKEGLRDNSAAPGALEPLGVLCDCDGFLQREKRDAWHCSCQLYLFMSSCRFCTIRPHRRQWSIASILPSFEDGKRIMNRVSEVLTAVETGEIVGDELFTAIRGCDRTQIFTQRGR